MIVAEFTGERVIPGLVEPSLWDEHVSRYSFAAGLAAGKRVLDVGCGTGYGAASLAEMATYTLGFDISPEAVDYATLHYGAKAKFVVGSAENFPAEIGSFDLITAFEVIEHLADWPRLLGEVNRVLADEGLFLVSTPNKTYYGESREREGPNPFHIHEFEYEEFREALKAWFPHVRILAQNRVEAFSFFGETSAPSGTATFAEAPQDVSDAHFYIAICGRQPIPALSYVYVPHEGNMLRERERHIQLLQRDLKTLSEEREIAAAQLAQFESDLEARGIWIAGLEQQILDHQRERDAALAALKTAENELEQRTDWALSQDQEVTKARGQVYELVAKLGEAEAVIIERTKWAQELERKVNERSDLDVKLDQARTRLSDTEATLADKELVIAELTSEVTRGRKELGLLLAGMRAQSAAAEEHSRAIGLGHSPALPHDEFAELGELVVELDKLRVSQARLFEIQMQTRSELQRRLESLTDERALASKSRWLKLGRALGLGPRLD
jgi:SAM-dependent methyltransferase